MLHPSTQQLIRKLHELTESGSIAWKEGKDGRCVFDTEGYQVEISAEPPSVRLLQGDGRELERADASDLAARWPDGEGTYATRVADMARHAGRIARGAETAIAKILSSLSAPAKKQPEPEPEPAALAFAAPVEKKAAVEAVTAGLEAQAKKTAEAPPVSHSLPDPAPVAVPAETETAIDRVLAVQPPVVEAKPAPQPEPPKPVAELKPTPQPEPPKPAPVAIPRPAPHVMDLPPPFADVTMQPPLRPVTAPAVMAVPPKPEPAPQSAPVAIAPTPKPEPSPDPIVAAAPAPPPAAAKPGFGSIDGFARSRPEPAPEPLKAEAPKPPSPNLLMTGISARSNQTVEQSTAKDFIRHAAQPAPAAPRPAAPAAAAPTPPPAAAPAPEKKLERATTGPDVYKPWA